MSNVMVWVRAYLRAIKQGEVIFGPALLLLLLSAAIVWVGSGSSSQEATGQEKAREATIRETPAPAVAESATPAAPIVPKLDLPDLPDLPKDQPKTERRPAGIPGLSDMDVIGYLQHLPGTNFRCPGGGPAGGAFTNVFAHPPRATILRSSIRSRW